MAICGNCGAESARIRSIFTEIGDVCDECQACAPQSFEKQTNPSDKKIWIGPEVRPHDYEKRYDADGVYYEPTPEATAELERNLFVNTEDKEKHERAVARKRREGRKEPLTPAEIEEAIKRANAILRPMQEDKETTFLV